jgi:NADH-quinone oxidoreductase subunit N
MDFAGLSRRQPVVAMLLTVFLLSLTGIPLTAGFFGKFYIFRAALHSDLIWLTVLGLLTSVVAAYYYLRVIVVMYMHEPAEATADLPPLGGALGATLWLSALGTVLLGIFPSLILDFAAKSALLAR